MKEMKNAVAQSGFIARTKSRIARLAPTAFGIALAAAPSFALAVDADTYGLPTIITALVTLAGAIYLAMGGLVTLVAGAEMAFGYLWKWVKKAGGGR